MKKSSIFIIISVLIVAVLVAVGFTVHNQLVMQEETSLQSFIKKEDIKENIKDWLYYNANYEDLICTEYYDNQAILYLQTIHCTPYYTSDAVIHQGEAAYDYIILAQMDKEQLSAISEYIDNLTPLQLDFLAYQLENAMNSASDLIREEEYVVKLFEAIEADSDVYSNITEDDLLNLHIYLSALLKEKGVKDEWKMFDTAELYDKKLILK